MLSKICCIALATSLIFSGCAQPRTVSSDSKDTPPIQQREIPVESHYIPKTVAFSVEGHRGARAIYPENSVLGFDYAITAGVNMIEFDTQYTKDGEIVLNHDAFVSSERCVGLKSAKIEKKSLRIHNMNYADIQKFDCGSKRDKFGPYFTISPTRIPRIEQMIEMLLSRHDSNARSVMLKWDIKSEKDDPASFPDPETIVSMILERVHKYDLLERSIFTSFDPRILEEIKRQEPRARIGLLVEWAVTQKTIDMAVKLGVDTLSPHYYALDFQGAKKLHDKLKRNGIKLVPYTVNDPDRWETYLKNGLEGIITDDPQRLLDFINPLAKPAL